MNVMGKPTPFLDEDGPTKEAISAFYEGMLPFWHPVLTSDALTDKPKRHLSSRSPIGARKT